MFIATELVLKIISFIGLTLFGVGLFKGRESYFKEGRTAWIIYSALTHDHTSQLSSAYLLG